ncbi:sensor histidine kinase [Homoserinimonas sp. OAct 916]|uniref:sensor histidine kinase n=1 Tax=Homoserinimonas sp. OAct 916 TaxID=2211450 RepID=UPI000DBE53EB|nr:ATP-binding protein [Homoserinimonas sp. OAct 916]
MKRIRKERDRLLRRSARSFGLAATIVASGCLLVPGVLEAQLYVVVFALIIALAFSQYRMGETGQPIWGVAISLTGLAVILVLNVSAGPQMNTSVAAAVSALAGGSLGSLGIVLVIDGRRFLLNVLLLAATLAVLIASMPPQYLVGTVLFAAVGWLTAGVIGWWLGASVPRVMRRISSIGRAHRAERQASETEAQRRQGARLLHDTVLGTLTLLAHAGVGVAPEALRLQAADDARLLRQLRTGESSPTPQMLGATVATLDEDVLGTTLESVKQRFHRMGLEVSWHGTGQMLLRSDILDSFLLALAECLENVRRHSGVTDAHVTIIDDETTVRAMVTDAGVGFDLDDIGEAKLGFKESVVARLKDVGGNARLFSTPGSGTTVVLEVPK